ncbi:molybdopterin-containing oxidoreductase family protein [Oceanibium sediminis]|uniref:molybdopterin-containing oxidoreductase family protein n=1 Tax=Oceanibium sediminis TaxID=2026339 RepID=UPI000DD46431|nr:molybdopterin-dependent oxidoreductase [Oceanibium sediminis]
MGKTPPLKTMCPMNCHPTLCGMTVTVREDRGVSIKGDPDNPDSRGFLCMRGHAAADIVDNPRRLLDPLRRDGTGGELLPTTWDAALDEIAAVMRRVGRHAVGFWQGHGNWANDYAFGLKRMQMDRFANLYGCQYWNPAMVCWGLGGFGAGITGALETSTKEDLGAHSELVILWGANTVSQANTFPHVEAAKRRGARIVVIDVRRTEAGALADEVLLLRPGSDAALALGMMHVIIAEGLHDADFVAAHTVGFEELAESLRDKTPDWTAEQTGLPGARILALARGYATTGPAMIVMGGSSMHKGDAAWAAARAITCLPGLTGNFGKPGAGIGPRHGARSHGVAFNDLTAADRRPPGARIPNQMEAIVEAMESGALKVLFSLGSNFLSSFPDTNRVKAALQKLDLLVMHDIFPNQTTREAADFVLPGTIWLEEIGAKSTNTHLYLADRILPPAGQARPVHRLYQDLAARLGVADVFPWADQEAAMNAALDHPVTGHATVESLRANGGRVALDISHLAYPTLEFSTPSGKIEFFSGRAADMGLPPLPQAPARSQCGPLTLTNGRTYAHFHAFYDHGRALPTLAAREAEPQLWIAPHDAEARGIAQGDAIEISNRRGSFAARALVTGRMPAGVVWMRDGWPGMNVLTDGGAVLPETALDTFPFSVGQANYGAEVEVRRRSG